MQLANPAVGNHTPKHSEVKHAGIKHEAKSTVYCPICTHTVEAMVTIAGKSAKVAPGQKCPRCTSSLDAGYVFRFDRAA
ncbi:MAG: hypothetical protein ACRD7E_05915 [Bryobacteraceae bacterium]